MNHLIEELGWEPTKLWRIQTPDGNLWMETSRFKDFEERREEGVEYVIYRMYQKTENYWIRYDPEKEEPE